MNHFIIHIPHLKKVIALTNPQKKLAEQGVEETEYLILQITTNAKDASVFELEWKERLGYPTDDTLSYTKSIQKEASAKYNQKKREERMRL